jgi:nucleotide-binding universal stress UspA family protein
MTVTYRQILVPLDGSERAAAALDHAATIAKLASARLALVQVIPSAAMLVSETAVASPSMGMPTVDPYLSASQFESVESALTEEAKVTLGAAAETTRVQGIDTETVLLQGAPADAILAYAQEHQTDLIVMSTHGRTGLARLVFGSVAESVLRRATCPVLLVRVAGE